MTPNEAAVLAELQRLEPLFHAACAEATLAQFETLVAPGFWEIGASGQIYTRDFVLDVLRQRKVQPYPVWQDDEHALTTLAESLYLLSYRLTEPTRVTRRTTLWRREPEGWRALFHQGTVVGISPFAAQAQP